MTDSIPDPDAIPRQDGSATGRSGTSVEDSAAAGAERPSWFRGKTWFWLPVVPMVVLDLWSKAAVFAFMAGRYGPQSPIESRWRHDIWINGVADFRFVAWRNTGTIWGLGKDFNTGLIVLRCFALLLLVWFASRTRRTERLQQCVLGLILAGAIGNLYDNLVMPDRGVRDFLSFTFHHLPFRSEPYPFPAFNVADSCICVGAITLAILLWRSDDPRPKTD